MRKASIVDRFLKQYIETALWSSHDTDEDGNSGDNLDALYTADDIAPEALASMREDCRGFLSCCHSAGLMSEVLANIAQAGHDFWLTRNRHGAGFWDGDWKEGTALTMWSKTFGSSGLYIGDDGRIYVS